jgi:hypothetical protein
VADSRAAGGAPAGIEITANAPRAVLEALYLELRELAKQRGFEIEFRLSKDKPE